MAHTFVAVPKMKRKGGGNKYPALYVAPRSLNMHVSVFWRVPLMELLQRASRSSPIAPFGDNLKSTNYVTDLPILNPFHVLGIVMKPLCQEFPNIPVPLNVQW